MQLATRAHVLPKSERASACYLERALLRLERPHKARSRLARSYHVHERIGRSRYFCGALTLPYVKTSQKDAGTPIATPTHTYIIPHCKPLSYTVSLYPTL